MKRCAPWELGAKRGWGEQVRGEAEDIFQKLTNELTAIRLPFSEQRHIEELSDKLRKQERFLSSDVQALL